MTPFQNLAWSRGKRGGWTTAPVPIDFALYVQEVGLSVRPSERLAIRGRFGEVRDVLASQHLPLLGYSQRDLYGHRRGELFLSGRSQHRYL